MLDLSKIEAGKLTIEEVPFDLNEAIETAIEMMTERAHAKGLEIAYDIENSVPVSLMGDPYRLRQILLNLIGNAIKFTSDGEVVLRVRPARATAWKNFIEFSVSDTGIGIPKDKFEAIFEAFAQSDSSVASKYGGTGLGLSISKRLVELMGGKIQIQSSEGKGSVFSFSIPFKIQPKSEQLKVDLRGIRMLVVDDNKTNRMILKHTLTSWGARVDEADCGKTAIENLENAKKQNDPYDLVILDFRMPGMDGLQVAQEIHKSPEIAGLPMMMFTSEDRSSDIAKIKDLDLSAYLIKPIKRTELIRVMSDFLCKKAPLTAPAPDTRSLRILLVDDSEDNRDLAQAYLKESGHTIKFCVNGKDAVEIFKTEDFDIVLMDVLMPIMDGYAATRAIRKWEADNGRTRTPIIAITAYALNEEKQKAMDAGYSAHLLKPIRKAALLTTISMHGGRRAAPGRQTTVKIDPDIRELIAGFLDKRRKDVQRLNDLIDKKDFEAISQLGHMLKGDGKSYGFDEISNIGVGLETSGHNKDINSIISLVADYESYLKNIKPVYE
ncbi:response regulator [Elusimicrobiota bacterium]